MSDASAESAHYENAELWDRAHTVRTESNRLNTMVGLVPREATSLLDAGGGNGLFLEKLRAERPSLRFSFSLDRSMSALAVASGGRLRSSLEALPFADAAFDMVTCLEVLEHLPVPVYQKVLCELARVARRYLMVAVPYRQNLERMLVVCPTCRARFNPYYHVRRFDEGSLRELFVAMGWACAGVQFQGQYREPFGADALFRLLPQRERSRSPFRFSIACPVCAERLPAALTPREGNASRSRGGLLGIVKRAWPKVNRQSRVVAIYRRAAKKSSDAELKCNR